ncbi:MAG: hypothetical protein IPP70_09895 [Elusimicrobia bacterium]|nr:hypothetical protein [Elusimicrobiota bacterium]
MTSCVKFFSSGLSISIFVVIDPSLQRSSPGRDLVNFPIPVVVFAVRGVVGGSIFTVWELLVVFSPPP